MTRRIASAIARPMTTMSLCLLTACSGGAGSNSGGGPAQGASSGGDDAADGSPPGVDGSSVGASDEGGKDAGSTDAARPDASGGATGEAGTSDGGLNAHVAPGGNFDLSMWELQEPVGSAGSPTTYSPAQLEGPNGHQDAYFFTDPVDGSMTFWDPENGVTTANSMYPRSELREMTSAGAPANWPTTGTNTLSATLKATVVPDHVCVGQIHLGTGTPTSTKPLLELFYFSSGSIVMAIEQTPAGGNEVQTPVGNAPLGTKWSYAIGLSGNAITLVIDGGATQSFAMPSSFDQENMYFKAGDYDQSVGSSSTIGAKVQFYALEVHHGP
jgi:hypothetical protein